MSTQNSLKLNGRYSKTNHKDHKIQSYFPGHEKHEEHTHRQLHKYKEEILEDEAKTIKCIVTQGRTFFLLYHFLVKCRKTTILLFWNYPGAVPAKEKEKYSPTYFLSRLEHIDVFFISGAESLEIILVKVNSSTENWKAKESLQNWMVRRTHTPMHLFFCDVIFTCHENTLCKTQVDNVQHQADPCKRCVL